MKKNIVSVLNQEEKMAINAGMLAVHKIIKDDNDRASWVQIGNSLIAKI